MLLDLCYYFAPCQCIILGGSGKPSSQVTLSGDFTCPEILPYIWTRSHPCLCMSFHFQSRKSMLMHLVLFLLATDASEVFLFLYIRCSMGVLFCLDIYTQSLLHINWYRPTWNFLQLNYKNEILSINYKLTKQWTHPLFLTKAIVFRVSNLIFLVIYFARKYRVY
jgi:hypothetical protein